MDFLSGSVLTEDGLVPGYVSLDDGKVSGIFEGRCPEVPSAEGMIIPSPVNSHTHCADRGVKVEPGMSLQELVAPPDGIKHRYLRDTPDEVLSRSMEGYASASRCNGIGRFIDFREGGLAGCMLLRKAVPDAVILGRPISPEYDPDEVDAILDVADGIGLSSISDVDRRYAESVAEHVHSRGKILSMHASERVREDIDAVLSLDPRFLVHMVEATDGDITKCAESEVPLVVCARSNMFFGKIPPIRRMLDCGAELSMGTDNAMLCDPDLRSEASVFAGILRSQGGDARDISDEMVVNGRKIIYGCRELSLRVGMDADLTVLPCRGDHSFADALANRQAIVSYRRTQGERQWHSKIF